MFKKLGFVNKVKFKEWCVSKEVLMERERWYGREVRENRFNLWFGVGINFDRSLSRFEGLEIDGGLRKRCEEFYGEGFNSLLLIRYGNGSKLNLHKDRDCFGNRVVIFNSGVCVFEYDGERKILNDGEVIEIDGKKDHGVIKCVGERFSLSIREVI
jgi:hypothetical protein